MGAYLSTPVTEKISVDRETKKLKYGASSMQGWRVAQEDAHNCCPEFEEDTALFAVYDGHGGSEVAAYSAAHLPDFLKSLPSYKEGKLAEALESAFLGFDAKLTTPEVIKELKELAGLPSDDNKEDGDEDEEPGLLMQESTMPLEQLLEKYGGAVSGRIRNLRKKDNFSSPVIKPKTDGESKDIKCEPESSSDPIKKSLDEELINGVSENENNENKEKEQAQSVASSCVDSNPETSSSNTAQCTDISTNGSDASSVDAKTVSSEAKPVDSLDNTVKDTAMLPDSSTDMCKPKVDTVSSGSKVEDGVSSGSSTAEEHVTSGSSCSSSTSKEVVCSSSSVSSAGSSSGSGLDAGSSSGSGPSAGGSSSSSAGGSACDAGSSSHEAVCTGSSAPGGSSSGGSSADQGPEAGSSSGRTRKNRVIGVPGEDEDEDSMTDDSEDSDVELDSDDEDIDALVEPDSEDDEDGLEVEDDLDDEEDDCGMGGQEEPGADSGTTAVLALLHGKDLHVANAGDSRCVLCRGGKAVDMSEDHKPEDEIEQSRILTAGGRVTPDGRVNGGLNLSRALGDHCYKRNPSLLLRDQMITPLPDIKSVVLTEEDEFMVLACDGIWNVMTSQDVVNFVRERIQSGVEKLTVICEEMFDFCLAPDTNGDGTGCDNMTCMIVKFNFITNDHKTASIKRQSSDSIDPETTKKQKTDS